MKSQGFGPTDVYDGRSQRSAVWKARVRETGQTLVLGTPCEAAAHRLRTRSGHCAQCNPANIAYQNRHNSSGYVYIAGSVTRRVIKIGTALDIEQRCKNLVNQCYGGITDWTILFFAEVDNGGLVESFALRRLEGYRFDFDYIKDGKRQRATEILEVNFSQALKAVVDAIGGRKVRKPWYDERGYHKYEFYKLAHPSASK